MVDSETSGKSRQKSCNACARRKRRCDRRTPKCAPCAKQGLSCLYHKFPSGSGSDNSGNAMDIDLEGLAQFFTAADQSFSTVFGTNFEVDDPSMHGPLLTQESSVTGATDATKPWTSVRGPTLPLELAPFDFNNPIDNIAVDTVLGAEIQLLRTPPDQEQSPNASSPRIPSPLLHADYRFPRDECRQVYEDFQAWQLYEPGSKIGFIIKSIKDTPGDFARTKDTSFLHRHLYRRNTPRSIITLYATVSAYASCNESNRDWGLRVLCEGVDELMTVHKGTVARSHGPALAQLNGLVTTLAARAQGHGGAVAGTGAANPVYEKLARTQALWMYQVMRMFDGDIRLRAQAEQDMPTLEAWLLELEECRDNLQEMWLLEETAVRERPPKSWESWIFKESLRRTILMGYSLIDLCGLLKRCGATGTDVPDLGHFVRVHRWTASGPLWTADSGPAFFAAWRGRRQTFVQNFFIQDFAKTAKPVDVDPLSKIMLAALLGVEEMEHLMLGSGPPPVQPSATVAL
ncbi:C6 zinc finger domain protein [Fusarium acuminatum]|uniref:C6 zinc finger domain protein n=1 Tax=Fusarium acuminatum TaxID=5515 RepID=A0ABZ2XC28_9HYPO